MFFVHLVQLHFKPLGNMYFFLTGLQFNLAHSLRGTLLHLLFQLDLRFVVFTNLLTKFFCLQCFLLLELFNLLPQLRQLLLQALRMLNLCFQLCLFERNALDLVLELLLVEFQLLNFPLMVDLKRFYLDLQLLHRSFFGLHLLLKVPLQIEGLLPGLFEL